MMGKFTRGACALAVLSVLAACSNDDTQESSQPSATPLGLLRYAAMQTLANRSSDAEPAAPRSPSDIAAEALSVNPGPLILVGLESMGTTQAMAMTGQNGDMRTFMTPNEQALILRNGMLTGTRGLGNDLSVAEAAQSAALIRAGRSGQAQRTMRYYTGDGLERPLPMTCTIGPGPNAGVMVESCEGLGASFQNNYMVSGGQITVSRQWIGPALGYVTIQTLRP